MAYCPRLYDIVWLQFDPQAGREQAGRRPAVILTPERYNNVTRLCVVCPITSQIKGYPFEVPLPATATTQGAVLTDHVKSLSWNERSSEFIEPCPDLAPSVLAHVKALLAI